MLYANHGQLIFTADVSELVLTYIPRSFSSNFIITRPISKKYTQNLSVCAGHKFSLYPSWRRRPFFRCKATWWLQWTAVRRPRKPACFESSGNLNGEQRENVKSSKNIFTKFLGFVGVRNNLSIIIIFDNFLKSELQLLSKIVLYRVLFKSCLELALENFAFPRID